MAIMERDPSLHGGSVVPQRYSCQCSCGVQHLSLKTVLVSYNCLNKYYKLGRLKQQKLILAVPVKVSAGSCKAPSETCRGDAVLAS